MKQITILVLIFLGLLGVYFMIREYADPKAFTPPEALSLNGWGIERFSTITLEGEELLTLEKQPDTSWRVNGKRAEREVIAVFLQALSEAKVVSKVSSNPENHERFDVGEAGMILTVTLSDNQEDQLIVGKGAGGNSVYVRLPQDDVVYVLDGLGRQLFRQNESLWRERTITETQASEVNAVSFVAKNENYTFERPEETWFISKPGFGSTELRIELFIPWLEASLGFQAGEYPTQEEIENAQDGASYATITFEKAVQDDVLTLYATDKEDFYLVVREADGEAFYVGTSSIDQQFTDFRTLRDQLDGE